jgi:hypothetical protein
MGMLRHGPTGRAGRSRANQTVCDEGAVHPVLILEQQAGFFKAFYWILDATGPGEGKICERRFITIF